MLTGKPDHHISQRALELPRALGAFFIPLFLYLIFMPRPYLLLLSLSFLPLSSCSQFGQISANSNDPVTFASPQLPPAESSPNIFKKYSATEDAVMAKGWARNFDMSGVSFDDRKTATLVTKRHVVMANHYKRSVGSLIIFHDRYGKKITRTLIKTRRVPSSDVAVGLLSEDLPSGYKTYALPTPLEDYTHLKGTTAAVTDQNRRIFFHKVGGVYRNRISFQHHKPNLHGWAKNLIKGDSGNPSFIISGGELVLIETHTFGGSGSGPFYGALSIQSDLQRIISEWSPGYRIRTKDL